MAKSIKKRKEYKPSGYWTKERCVAEAKKYKNRISFKKSNASAFNSSRNNGWLDIACSHMPKRKKINKKPYKWTRNKIFKALKEIKTWDELTHKNQGLMAAIRRTRLVSIVRKRYNPRINKYSKEQLREIALRYTDKRKFRMEQESVLRTIYNNQWQEELLHHMSKSCYNNYLEIEKLLLHPKIINLLKKYKYKFKHEKEFVDNDKFIIPDFIFEHNNVIYVIEAKTSYQKWSKNKLKFQIERQRKTVDNFYGKKVIMIIVSEYGRICSKSCNYNMSLEEFEYFLKNNEYKFIDNTFRYLKSTEVQEHIEKEFFKKINILN